MLQYVVKPIVQWPGDLTKSSHRKYSRFNTAWGKTLALLEKEIRFLSGKNVIFQCAVREQDIRLDGGVRSNARPAEHPGIIITFDSKHGPLSYHTDQYNDFQANVRAIALALEALRTVDRYGVNKAGSQYAGYKRLPPASTNGKRGLTKDEARSFIAYHSGVAVSSLGDSGVLDLAFKAARRRLHPDNQETGSDGLFVELTEAMAVLLKG
jgi:hypothetical protein